MRTQGFPILHFRPLGEGLRFCKSSLFNCSLCSLPSECVRFKGELNPRVIKKLCVQCSLLGNAIHTVFVDNYQVGLLSTIRKLHGALCQSASVICCGPEKIFFVPEYLRAFPGWFFICPHHFQGRWKELGTDNTSRNEAKRNERTCPRSRTTSAAREG